jgi:hypothetical protein
MMRTKRVSSSTKKTETKVLEWGAVGFSSASFILAIQWFGYRLFLVLLLLYIAAGLRDI